MKAEISASITFSLVMATFGRTAEVENFLAYLGAQSYRKFELIVVDQNGDDRLKPILRQYESHFPMKHLRSKKGLSRARNVGLEHITGDVVAFPDDDCWYASRVLERVATMLCDHPEWDGITGMWEAPSSHVFERRRGFLDKFNVWRRSMSITVFLRSSVIRMVGDFDESLGAGSSMGFESGEETDYLLRAIENGCRIYYNPDLCIHHPEMRNYDTRRAHVYGRGLGHTLKKHQYPIWFLGYMLMRSLGGAVLSVGHKEFARARYYCAMLHGRLEGWFA